MVFVPLRLFAVSLALAACAGASQAGMLGVGTWETTLQPRDLDGDGVTDAFYDTVLDITWLRDANPIGLVSWETADSWAKGLVIGGIGGWRLPSVLDIGAPGCQYNVVASADCGYNPLTKTGDVTRYEAGQTVYSEMAHLFYVTLGNRVTCLPPYPEASNCQRGSSYGYVNPGGFLNVRRAGEATSYPPGTFWLGLRAGPTGAWTFRFNGGYQAPDSTIAVDRYSQAMAVHDGDVGKLPHPAPAPFCGYDRWPIKTGMDAEAALVDTTIAVPSSPHGLTSIAAPRTRPTSSRAVPVERQVYAVDAQLTFYGLAEDSDYYMLLFDAPGTHPDGTRRTVVARIPHPGCVGASSPFRAAIAAARAEFDSHLTASPSWVVASIPVRVHGVGFFSTTSRLLGTYENDLHLSPVLKIEFNPTRPAAADATYPLASIEERLFNWAEAEYSHLFPKPSVSGTYERYIYRYYASTGNYLAIADGRVIVHNGRDWKFLDVGPAEEHLSRAAGAGY